MLDGNIDFKGTARFEVRRRLGAGGMGVVYEAFDRERQTAVALKTLRALDQHSLYRFKNEFRLLADLRHPNLARLGELYCEDGQWFFTMELVNGVSFLSYVNGEHNAVTAASPDAVTFVGNERARSPARRFDEKRLRTALTQLTLGVDALHASGKIHRDIKPSNILVAHDGRTILLDFGLVTDLVADEENTDGIIVGTAAYMAPEQCTGRRVGAAADWYSVGVVLYEALTGLKPFDGPAPDVVLAKQESDPAPPHTHAAGVPPDLDALCMALLSRDPGARPNGAQILARLGTDLRVGPAPAAAPEPATGGNPFVGRESELAALRGAFEHSRTGHGVILALHGESGLGKSALVRTFLQSLRTDEPYAVVLSARCYEREELPFKAFDGIVDALSRHLSHLQTVASALMLPRDIELLARVFPVLRRIPAMAEVVESRLKVPNPQEVRTRAFAALRELLTRLAERTPLVLFVDDFQWADADSLALLNDVMHPPDAPPLLLVATVRTSAAADALRRSLSAELGDVRHLELAPLPPARARELVELLLPDAAKGAGDAIAIVKEAAGHPLFIQELVHHALAEGVGASHSVRLDEALGARIERLEPPARAFLEAVAVAAAPLPQRLIAQAAGLTDVDYADRLGQLRAAHLVRSEGSRGSDSVEPYHDRIRDAVLAHLAPEARMRHHARLAQALEGAGVGEHDPRVLVRHLEGAGQPARAARFAERAAKMAAEALAFDRAAELVSIALRLGEYDETERRALWIHLGDVLVNAGRGSEAADAYLSAAEGADATVRLECHRRAAEQLLGSGHIDRGLKTLAAVLAEVGERLPPSPRQALISLLWQRVRLRLRGHGWKPKDVGEIAARELTRLDIYKTVAIGLAMVDNVRGADFQARGLLLALRTGERRRLGRALAFEASYVGSQGHRKFPKARHLLEEAQRIAVATGDSHVAVWVKGSGGVVSYLAGSFRDAAQQLADVDPLLRDSTDGISWETNTIHILRLFALRRLGSWNELSRWFDEYVRDAVRRGDRYAEISLRYGCNAVWLARGLPEEAEGELARAAWAPSDGGYHMQHWYGLRARAEIALYRGNATTATLEQMRAGSEAARRSLLTRIQIIRSETSWLRGRLALAATAATPQADLTEVRQMVRLLERERVGYATVWARLLGAGIAYREEHFTHASELLQEAAALAEQANMGFDAAIAKRRLAEIAGGSAIANGPSEFPGIKDFGPMCEVVAPGFASGNRLIRDTKG
jgi:tRNA A-37 threonylcarbamoyl transferase component Bud32